MIFNDFKLLKPYTDDKILDRIITYMLVNIEGECSKKEIAFKFYVSYAYVSTMFSNKLNLNYNKYVTEIKIAKAEYLLIYTVMKLSEMCNLIGYKDLNYFQKLFREKHGLAIFEYRNSWRLE